MDYLLVDASFGLVACVTVHVTNSTRVGYTPEYKNWRNKKAMCQHQPSCPSADAIDRDAAKVVASFPEQGWSLLCNGVIVFEDTGEILPDGSCVSPHRGPALHALA